MNDLETHTWTGSADDEPTPPRLDVFLGRALGLSRRRVRDLLAGGHVRIDGQVAALKDKGRPLSPGERVSVERLTDDGQQTPRPDPTLVLEELQRGEGWVVVNKPAGVPVRPHHPGETGTVINALAAKHPGIVGVGEGGLRSGVVHRLDTDTSGCLVVATTQDAWGRLRAAFAEHRAKKTYTAIVHGKPPGIGPAGTGPAGSEQRLTLWLTVARAKNAWVRVSDTPVEGARECSLTWRALRGTGLATLVEIDLETGFLHQIRAMLAHIHHPVIGDERYAEGMQAHSATRQMLHASALEIEGLEIMARSVLPGDISGVVDRLGV